MKIEVASLTTEHTENTEISLRIIPPYFLSA
jgi:hypothetical protein